MSLWRVGGPSETDWLQASYWRLQKIINIKASPHPSSQPHKQTQEAFDWGCIALNNWRVFLKQKDLLHFESWRSNSKAYLAIYKCAEEVISGQQASKALEVVFIWISIKNSFASVELIWVTKSLVSAKLGWKSCKKQYLTSTSGTRQKYCEMG